MSYRPGDDIIVNFDGVESRGAIISIGQHTGYIMCEMLPDMAGDYDASIGPRLTPVTTVCVLPTQIKPAK
jgi:hypothetical protein